MRLGDIKKIKFGLIFCFIFWDFVPVLLSVIDLRQMVLSLICKFPTSTLLHWLNNCDLILLLRRISLKVVNAMVSKVIFKIKFISIAINLHFGPHKSFLEIFYGLSEIQCSEIWHSFQRASEQQDENFVGYYCQSSTCMPQQNYFLHYVDLLSGLILWWKKLTPDFFWETHKESKF